jgi:hypothetical protein
LYDLLKSRGQFVTDYDIKNMQKTLLGIKRIYLNKDKLKEDYSDFSLKELTLRLEKLFI